MLKAKDYKEQKREIGGIPIKVISYRIGDTFHCHVANVEPGSTIARSDGKTPDEAQQLALKKAAERLSRNGR